MSRIPSARPRTLVCLSGLALSILLITPGFSLAQTPASGATLRPFQDIDEPTALLLALAPAAKAAELLPISRVTLYRSGVGHFQRQGTVNGDSQLSLKFETDQINDVLKSLQVLDFGGRVQSVSYPSKDPLSRRLSSFSIQIGDNPSLPVLLERLRGSQVSLQTADATITGSVLSVETRDMPVSTGNAGDRPAIIKTPIVNLLTGTGIRAVPVPSILNFKISDQGLAEELNKALAALSESRTERTKVVDVTVAGTGSRQVAITYVHATPVWKTSYRLVLPDADPKPAGEGKPSPQGVLQGWAIVENTTDQDWSNVKLSLVSGRPVSFRMDLYEPLYVTRPEVPVPTVPGVMPRTYEGGLMPASVSAPSPASPPSSGSPGASAGSPFRQSKQEAAKDKSGRTARPAVNEAFGTTSQFIDAEDVDGAAITPEQMVDYAARPQTKAGEVGEVFQFELENPVTIERQRSAMIPLLTANVDARRVSIFNLADRADHPMRGVEVTNSSSMQLLPGPLSVMDGSAYAGDATVNQIAPGDKRLLAYAVDLDVAVTTEPVTRGTVNKIRIVKGSLEQTISSEHGMKYTFANKDLKRGRTIVLEHPKFEGYTLKGDLKPREQTQTAYRFDVSADAGKQVSIDITQERVDRQIIGINAYPMETLMRLSQDGRVSDKVLTAMRDLFARQANLANIERVINEREQQINTLKSDQSRITGVMQPLDRNTDTYRNFLTKLNKQEADIDKLNTAQEASRTELDTARNQLDAALEQLNVD